MKILIAEKDLMIRELVKTRLEVRGYEVREAAESGEAVRLLERERCDLAILGSSMERIGRDRLIEAIRKRPHLISLPIILLADQGELSELVLTRDRGYDDFLVKPFNPFVLQLRVSINIDKARQRTEANALTHLPGNHAIEKVILQKIEHGEKFSVLYVDITNFKPFNDYYSFEKGDDVIRQVAQILLRTAQAVTRNENCFVGHIGGDDFIVVLPPEKEEPFARAFIAEFDQIIPTYYNEIDRRRGFIRVTNRRGKKESFPMMSCTVAACTNLYRNYKSLGEIARDAMEVKAFLKSQKGSHYLRDRRTEPLGNLEQALKLLVPEPEEKDADPPLGQMLLQDKLITAEELEKGLKEHLRTGRKLGEVLVALRIAKPEEVGRVLSRKLQVPYRNLRDFTPGMDVLKALDLAFMTQHQVMPLERNEEGFVLGMAHPQDAASRAAAEAHLGMKVLPVLVMEGDLLKCLERIPKGTVSISRGTE